MKSLQIIRREHAVLKICTEEMCSGADSYEKAVADFHRNICLIVRDTRLGWHRDFSPGAADPSRGRNDRWPYCHWPRRDRQWSKRLAGNGRNGERLYLGAWLVCGARLVSGLSASRSSFHTERMVAAGLFKRLRQPDFGTESSSASTPSGHDSKK